jgi:hypothetical protein
MRSLKIVPALAATAALLALAPAGASAAKHPGRKAHSHALRIHAGSCRVKINTAPRFIAAGESSVVFGALRCPSAISVAGQTVTILQRSAGSSALSTAGTATTDPTGHYQLGTPALLMNSFFSAAALGSQSGQRPVKVAPKVSVGGPADGSQLFTGGGPFIRSHDRRLGLSNRVTFTGTVSPADAGAGVALQREGSVGFEEWSRIAPLGQVGPDGTYSITHTFGTPGDANIRVVVRPSKVNSAAASETLSYEISQAQNPALTIQSSADPISYGAPVTISGVISAGAGTPVTLLARTRQQSTFAAVASAISTTGGAYAFPVQTPLKNTFYEVTGVGKTSARLFEGVKYGLTAGASSNSVQAGQPLSITGTVSPGHVGQPVYLQAQYPSGIGFHVVEVTAVTAASTYTIIHTPFFPGAKKLRIKVPGNPENQGVASALFGVEVMSAPPAALTPELPNNSSQPSEGHL